MQLSNSFTEYDIHELYHDLKCHETIILVVLTTMEQGTSEGPSHGRMRIRKFILKIPLDNVTRTIGRWTPFVSSSFILLEIYHSTAVLQLILSPRILYPRARLPRPESILFSAASSFCCTC